MKTVHVIIRQLLTMAVYCAIGCLLSKRRLLSREGCSSISKLLLYVFLPCVIVQAFTQEDGRPGAPMLLGCLVVSALLLGLSILMSSLLLRRRTMEAFAASFSNTGFIGISLVRMALGVEAVVYVAPFIALLNVFQWIYGQRLRAGAKDSMRQLLCNPLVLAFLAGVVCSLLSVHLPAQLSNMVSALAACNSPLAMIVIGAYLAEIPLREIFVSRAGLRVSAVRLLVVPLLSVLLLVLVPGLGRTAKSALTAVASTPVAVNVAIYAELLNSDYRQAVIFICQSAIFCLLTMPMLLLLAETLF